MKPKYIAAIEIGSSRIKGIVGAVDETASITVLAVEELDSGDTVRYGRVQNALEAAQLVNEIVRRLENNQRVAPGRISSVFIAHGGRSLCSQQSEATIKMGGDAEITRQTLERIHKEARYNLATASDVLAIAPRRYTVDNAEVKKIVGAYGNVIRGEFTIITASHDNRRALDRLDIQSRGNTLPREYITRLLAQCDMGLSDSDRQLGCMFIDFGAETTTMAIFRNGALQAAATLPMGSANINRDLCAGLSITAESAENIKISKGRAVTDRVSMQAPDEETREIINFVSARTSEIIANIINFMEQSGFKASELTAGAVVTGGGCRLKGFCEMLEAQSKLKVRRAAVDSSIIMLAPGVQASDCFDVISLVKYAAARTDTSCVTFPEAAAPAQPQQGQGQTQASAPASQGGTRRNAPSYNDPNLLEDDMDEEYDQPDNINGDTDLDDIPQGKDANSTRMSLVERFRNWLAPKDDNFDN